MQSPKDFGAGIAKGTLSLVRYSLFGMIDFTARISTTISLSLTNATLALDLYTGYPPASGALDGLAQGITGLIVCPMNGLEMDGIKVRGSYTVIVCPVACITLIIHDCVCRVASITLILHALSG